MSNELEWRLQYRPLILTACDMMAKDAYDHNVDHDDLIRGVYEWVHIQLSKGPIPQWMKDDPNIKINTIIEGELGTLPGGTQGEGPGVIEG